jgi:PIN domain nuclease of toxin-antitoxin system
VILLDTHAWVRWLRPEISRKLPDELRAWLEASDEPFAVSVISALEVAQLVTIPVPSLSRHEDGFVNLA